MHIDPTSLERYLKFMRRFVLALLVLFLFLTIVQMVVPSLMLRHTEDQQVVMFLAILAALGIAFI